MIITIIIIKIIITLLEVHPRSGSSSTYYKKNRANDSLI